MAGLPWFAVYADFPDHPKTIRLAGKVQDRNAGMYVIRLLTYCARYAPSGVIDRDLVEHASGWVGEPGVLLQALTEVGFVADRKGGVEVHGWQERNGAHARKVAADAKRPAAKQRKSREIPARELLGNPGIPALETDSQTETEKKLIEPANHSEQKLAGRLTIDEGLVRVAAKLAAHYGRDNPLGVGKDWKRVEASFGRWLHTVGEDALVAECIRLAKEQNVEPSHLSWWPGWLDTVPETALQRAGGLQ